MQNLPGGEALPQILSQAQLLVLAQLHRGQQKPQQEHRRTQNDQRQGGNGQHAQRPGGKAQLLPQDTLVVDEALRVTNVLDLHKLDLAVFVLEEPSAQCGEFFISQQKSVRLAVAVYVQLGMSVDAPFLRGLRDRRLLRQLIL